MMTAEKLRPELRTLLLTAVLAANSLVLLCQSAEDSANQPVGLDWIIEQCRNGLDFNSIQEFRSFLREIKQFNPDQLKKDLPKQCRHSHEAILELENLVTNKNVCDPNKIDALIGYHKKYLHKDKSITTLVGFHKAHITGKFFTKYAIQTARVCKENLIKNLVLVREELRARSKVFDEARDKVYQDEPHIEANMKLIEEQPDDPASMNVKPRDEVEMSLNEYREALVKLRRPEDILTFEREECVKSKARHLKVATKEVNTFFKPALICHQLARFYAGSILSIAKLANHGYMAMDPDLDLTLADNPMVRDWIIAVQVCEPMMYMRIESSDENESLVDTCAERVSSIEEMVFDDDLVELDINSLREMIPRSEATRDAAQKIMRSAMKKMAKLDLLRLMKDRKEKPGFLHSIKLIGTALKKSVSHPRSLMIEASNKMEMSHKIASDILRSTVQSLRASRPNRVQTAGENDGDWSADEGTIKSLVDFLNQSDDSEVKSGVAGVERSEEDQAVSVFDPVSSLTTFITVIAIMLTFEWLFFIVMTLAARICHRLYFNFDNILTFPPKVLSWSDADFAKFNDKIEKIEEDDLFDFDELNPDEQRQRELLTKVFGRPPPMVYRE